MSNLIDEYINLVHEEADLWFEEEYDRDVYPADRDTAWDEAWDDMAMDVTGNNGNAKYTPDEYIKEIVWDSDFIGYCEEMGTNIGELIKRGIDVIDCYARYYILDYCLAAELYNDWSFDGRPQRKC